MRPLDLLLYHMRAVADSEDEWRATFAKSMLRKAQNPDWVPSLKERRIMNQLADELFEPDDFDLIDGDEVGQ